MARSAKARSRTASHTLIQIRLPWAVLDRITDWSAKTGVVSRSEAIRRLVQIGLDAPTSLGPSENAKRAAELAEAVVAGKIDPAIPPTEKAVRKRRILKGPSDFVAVRKDKPK